MELFLGRLALIWVAVLLCGSGQSVAAQQVDTSSWHTALQLMADSLPEQPAAVLLSARDLRLAMAASDWDKGKGRLHFLSGKAYVKLNQLDSGIYHLRLALLHYEASREEKAPLAETHYELGRAISNQDQYEASIPHFKKALAIYTALNNEPDIIRCHISYAWVLVQLGDFALAMAHLYDAIRLGDKLGLAAAIFDAQHELGNIFIEQGDMAAARDIFLRNATLAESLEAPYKQSVAYGDLALYYSYADQMAEALRYDLKDLAIQQSLEHSPDLALVFNNVGADYLALGQVDKAIEHFLQALEQGGQHRDVYNRALSLSKLGEAYGAQGQYDKAISYLQQAVGAAEEMQNQQLLQDARKMLIKLYQNQGQYQAAFETNEAYHLLKDSLFSLENKKQVAELATEYETEKKEQAIQLLQRDAQISRSQRQLLLLLLLALLLGGWLLRISFLRSRQKEREIFHQQQLLAKEKQQNIHLKNEQLQAKIEYQNQQLTAKALQLCQKNELLQKLADQLQQLPGNSAEQLPAATRKIHRLIHQNLHAHKDWMSLLDSFTEVHPDFLQQLQQQHRLTQNEMRLACLMRMNLSTKEISSLLNISPESVKKARYRLRKKLDLHTDDDIYRYLLQW